MLTPEMYMEESTKHWRGGEPPKANQIPFPEMFPLPLLTFNPSQARVKRGRGAGIDPDKAFNNLFLLKLLGN